MKKKIALVAGLCLLVMAAAVSAQEKQTNFAGDWKLDKDKSELGERNRIESMTMKVTQTEKELTVERKAERAGRPGDEGEGRGRRGMRGGGGNQQPLTYSLDGKETKATTGGGRFGGEAKLKAKSEKDGKMKLMQTRSFEGPMGSMSIKTTEIWELSADGKTLTVSSETETPRGTRSSKMVFMKEK
jgi:hypothetical protein